MDQRLTAPEAAARLGVKRETLYAYVSRGLLDRTLSLDGRSSLFDANQVDALRSSRRRPARGELRTVVTTSITELRDDGHRYRSLPMHELANRTFESVADLLWQNDDGWSVDPEITTTVRRVTAELPDDTPIIDRYRVAIAVASGCDPLRHNPAPVAYARAGRAMVAATVAALPLAAGGGASDHIDTGSSVAALLAASLIRPTASGDQRPVGIDRAVNLAMVLLADHGLAASTFGARIAASVRADPYSIVAAGLGPVGGKLHGAASLAVHELVAASAAVGVDRALGAQLERGGRAPGVGHAVYRKVDPRESILMETIEQLWVDDPRLRVVTELRHALGERVGLVPNIDLALGSLTWLLGAEPWAGEAIFAVARIAGWIAHGIEELSEEPIRFRPTARYVESPPAETLAIAADLT